MVDCACGGETPDATLMPTGIFRDELRADYESLYQQRVTAAQCGKRIGAS